MSQQVSIGEVERRSFAARFEDGLSEIYMGIGLIALAVPEVLPGRPLSETDGYLVSVAICALALLPWWAANRFLSVPRMGTVRLGPAGKRRQNRTSLVLLGSAASGILLATLVVAWAVLSAGSRPVLPSAEVVAALMAGWVLLVFGTASHFMGFRRGYVIGAVFAAGFGLSVLLGSSLPFMACGMVVVLMGLAVFVRFMVQNPVPVSEGSNVTV